MKKLYLLGATGSIGLQTIEIIRSAPKDYVLAGLSGYNNFLTLKALVNEFEPEVVCVKGPVEAQEIMKEFPRVKVLFGEKGLVEIAGFNPSQDITIINALVGMVGLKPTLKAIEANRTILLANKETLVVGGHLIKEALSHSKAKIYPIDSEHSALWQLLNGEDIQTIKRLIITASGGAFRDKSRDELETVNLESALNHPNWSMGKKITIDSATMINKGFEIIEAAYLFDIDIEKIDAVIHHESIIHSLVEFNDGSITAQLADHDMRLPIAYALNYPLRKPSIAQELDIMRLNNLHFETLSKERYPMIAYAKEAYITGGSMRTVLNSANEIAVKLFLEKRISFLEIERIVRKEMDNHQVIEFPSVTEIYQLDQEIKKRVEQEY